MPSFSRFQSIHVDGAHAWYMYSWLLFHHNLQVFLSLSSDAAKLQVMASFHYLFCFFALLWPFISFQHVNAESIQCDAGREPASNSINESSSYAKPRVFILSDILNEPDDSMSLVRLLVYSNLLDIRGLCATTSFFLPNATHPEEMIKIVEAYGSVVDNLNRHVSAEFQFSPSEKFLSLVTSGPNVSCMIYGAPFCWNHSQLTLRLKGLRNRSSQRLSQ